MLYWHSTKHRGRLLSVPKDAINAFKRTVKLTHHKRTINALLNTFTERASTVVFIVCRTKPDFQNYTYGLLTKCEVKIAGY